MTQEAQGDQPEQEQWVADEVYVCADITEQEATERQDELWQSAQRASMTTEQRLEELEQGGDTPAVPEATASAVAFMLSATPMSDEQALEFADVFPEWEPDKQYKADVIMRYGGELYRTNQAFTSSSVYPPDKTPTLYVHIVMGGDGIPVWSLDALASDPNAYNTGKKVHYPDANGPVYTSKRDGNTSVPGTDQWWKISG